MVGRLGGTLLFLAVALSACSSGGGTKEAASTTFSALPPSTSAPASSSTTAPATCAPVTAPAGGNGAKEVNDPGDIPDNQAFVPYTPPAGGVTVKVPEGWARTVAGGVVTFTDKFNSIRIEVLDAAAPTVASATSTEVPAIQASANCFEAGKVTQVQRTSGPAILITYRMDGLPDPVTGKVVREAVERYEFAKGGKEAVLTLAGAVGADNVDPWRIVSDSFTWR
ncbi:MAG: lipoprotein [Actinomycetia bacterium]|nr:lipoprotein [Actinomycetes bacterium]